MSINDNFWVRVSKEQDNFTKKEKIIINYINNNSQNMNNCTISDLSKANNVGYSVVYKLIKKLGFTGYRDFIINIVAQETTFKALNHEFFGYRSVLKETYRKLLDLNDSAIDYQKLKDFVVWLNEQRTSIIYIAGIGHSALGAEDLTLKLYRFGFKAICLNRDDDNLLLRSSLLKPNEILILFSLSGKTEVIIKAAELGKANGATVVVITSQDKSILNHHSDWLFTIVSSGLAEEKEILISPLFPITYFNDLITSYILKLPEKDWYLENRNKSNKVIKKIN
ncbi:MAG: MurR/RpiR family transcriptional regulator [Spiroplasma sp.]|nr:MurR/RpiR family transcriptional regulator [Spiroplasma sp.]